MSYQTGTSSDPSDLLSKLRTFAAANGWTVGAASAGHVLSKSGIVCGIFADATTAQLRGATAVNLSNAWNNQTNNAGATVSCNLGAGPFPAYHFYADDEDGAERLYAAVEIAAGVYRHILICQLVKVGWTGVNGGTYIAATFHSLVATQIDQKDSGNHVYLGDSISTSNCHLWCDADGRTNSWSLQESPNISTVTKFSGSMRTNGLNYNIYAAGHARYSLRNDLQPMMISQNRNGSAKTVVGYVPNLRIVNMQLIPVGFQDNIGGDDYDFWPNTLRTDNNGSIGASTPSSGWYGYASKHVV